MRRFRKFQGWSTRPQLGVLFVGALLIFSGAVQVWAQAEPGIGSSPATYPPLLSTSQPAQLPLPQADCARVACLALTFDDGPHPTTTPQVLDILQQYHVRASFFVLGSRAAAMPDLLRRMHQAGHEVGNHSWGHPDLTTLAPEQIQAEIANTQAAVIAAGLPAPRLFRPPYGAVNAMVKSHIPLTIALWNVDPEDWHTANPAELINKVLATAKPGGVVDMHDIDPATPAALPVILQTLQGRYQFVTMSEMLNLSPGQRGVFYGRWHP